MLSSVYTLGMCLLTIFSVPGILGMPPSIPTIGPMIALFGLIPLGTGGIKPCVSAHGGDQFLPSQTKGLNDFYNYFYMSINVGSILTSFLSPLLQER
jgi:dipeptide/tripeptide permease